MINELEERIKNLEEYLISSKNDARNVIKGEITQNYRLGIQPSSLPSLTSALCVNTIDPMAMGRVQYFTPFITAPKTPVKDLPWAYPISPFGGFDDSGVSWVPPAGSKLAIFFENGDKNQAYYCGTIHPRTRGVKSEDSVSQNEASTNSRFYNWQYNINEYECKWEGTRDGYNLGSNDGDQIRPPWNTDNYQTKDWDSKKDFDDSQTSQSLITYPHQYGFKTNEKHYLKMVDGDSRCNHRYRRVEMATGRGNIFMMKDDHLHDAKEWAFSDKGLESAKPCSDQKFNYDDQCLKSDEKPDCEREKKEETEFSNPFYKRKEEMRFYDPVESLKQYGAPKCELPQSGIQIQSIGGMQFVMDDSVDEPQGEPRWNRDFDFGCNDKFMGKMFLRSTTGHVIELNDVETDTLIRGETNGIRIKSASGNRIQLNDHTLGSKGSPEKAGEKRGIEIESTSKHILKLHDEGNEQYGLPRKEGAEPAPLSDKAYVLLRSGYGLQLLMEDSESQEETQNQKIQLLAPMKDNEKKGPHMLLMQEAPNEEPGLVFLRCGGNFVFNSTDNWQEIVGDEKEEGEERPTKSVQVNGKYVVNVKDYYFNKNDITLFVADKYIFLLAGKDCPVPDEPEEEAGEDALSSALDSVGNALGGNTNGDDDEDKPKKSPCIYPLIVAKDPFVCPYTNYVHFGIMPNPDNPEKYLLNSMSDRVFASCSNKDKK